VSAADLADFLAVEGLQHRIDEGVVEADLLTGQA
jgi:hypothetical protein